MRSMSDRQAIEALTEMIGQQETIIQMQAHFIDSLRALLSEHLASADMASLDNEADAIRAKMEGLNNG